MVARPRLGRATTWMSLSMICRNCLNTSMSKML
ncbi:hypothetical protein FOPG_13973 [Fusarium oxysporum f. sp. conglutinans race 2 54008]|uniref:Uncharacterized protein n=1 Tax=Fusarium oxysporum f. sp. conglutinans race 2 54008 TaxID=1089457 RepID=X0H2Q5_FUSOX|nr:hypothetical protein FOPG_13973 [Fusarium oxysporum f. sp. conglutinans race 2 54008]